MLPLDPKSGFRLFNVSGLLLLFLLSFLIGKTDFVVYAQTIEPTVGMINGKSISQKDVDESVISQLYPLQQQIYALRKIALDNLILRRLLEDEAKRRGISVEELRKQLSDGRIEIPTNQVEDLYHENAATFAAMSPDEAKERLRLDLESQARMRNYREALLKLKERSTVQIFLEEPRLPSQTAGDSPTSTGAANAAVTITEFADFQCSYCRQAHNTLKQLLREYKDEVRLVFKHLPLDNHPQAASAAIAAYCAGEQNSFWQYHDAIFASESLSPARFKQISAHLGLDLSRFGDCIDSEAARMAVSKDVREARRLGINGTPAFIINGKLVRGIPDLTEFKNIIERELTYVRATSRKQ